MRHETGITKRLLDGLKYTAMGLIPEFLRNEDGRENGGMCHSAGRRQHGKRR
jgi:hypothetical protein